MDKKHNTNAELMVMFDSMTIEEKYICMLKDMRRLNRYCSKLEMQRDELKQRCEKLESENTWLKCHHIPNEEKIQNIASYFITWLKKRNLVETSEELTDINSIKEKMKEYRKNMIAK